MPRHGEQASPAPHELAVDAARMLDELGDQMAHAEIVSAQALFTALRTESHSAPRRTSRAGPDCWSWHLRAPPKASHLRRFRTMAANRSAPGWLAPVMTERWRKLSHGPKQAQTITRVCEGLTRGDSHPSPHRKRSHRASAAGSGRRPLRRRQRRRHAADRRPVHAVDRARRQRSCDLPRFPGRNPRAAGHDLRRLRLPDQFRLAARSRPPATSPTC